MIFAHLVAREHVSKIVGARKSKNIELGITFVSDDIEAEKRYTEIFKKQTEIMKAENITEAVRQFERFLCYHEFIPTGKTGAERSYYKVDHKKIK